MAKKQKIILVVVLAIVILAALLIWGLSRTSEKELIQENPNLPESEWTLVSIRGGEEDKVVTNKTDGYEISIPADWNTPEIASRGSGYEITYQELTLRIFTLNSIEEAKVFFPPSVRFEDKVVSAKRAYRASLRASQDTLDNRGNVIEVPIKDSLVVGYLIPSGEKTYVVSCFATGDNFNELVSLCEKQILTFKISR